MTEQKPNFNIQDCFGNWPFEFIWSLEFGYWNLYYLVSRNSILSPGEIEQMACL
jgi:hypothetical protein